MIIVMTFDVLVLPLDRAKLQWMPKSRDEVKVADLRVKNASRVQHGNGLLVITGYGSLTLCNVMGGV